MVKIAFRIYAIKTDLADMIYACPLGVIYYLFALLAFCGRLVGKIK